jgi:hypothetical protein
LENEAAQTCVPNKRSCGTLFLFGNCPAATQEPEEARREETAKVKTPAGNLTVRGGMEQRK